MSEDSKETKKEEPTQQETGANKSTDVNQMVTEDDQMVAEKETVEPPAEENGNIITEKEVETKTAVEEENVVDKEEEKKEEEKKEEEIKEEKKEEKKEEEKKDDEKKEENDDEESEEELPPGLLEKPIEILGGKRERKKVARYTYDDATPTSEKKKLEIVDGKGIKLSDHPRVEWQLARNKSEDLKIIHKLFFGTFGDTHFCKKNLRKFSGFNFEKNSPEYEKKEDYIGRFTLDNLKWVLTVCDVENKKGLKDDLIDHLLEWCLDPRPTGKALPEKRRKSTKKGPASKRKRKSSSAKESSAANNTSTTSSLSSDSDSNSEVEEKAPTKSPVKSPKAKKTPNKKKTPKKRASTDKAGSPKKIAKIKISQSKKSVSDSSDSSDDDAPLQKKSKPTNAQIRKSVEKILKGANLEEITMKNVCLKVYSLYPDFDLADRKPFIKETVKKIIS